MTNSEININAPVISPNSTSSFSITFGRNHSLNQINLKNDVLNEKHARSILTLAKWLGNNPSTLAELNSLYTSQKTYKNTNYIPSTSIQEISENLMKILALKNVSFANRSFNLSRSESLIGDLLDIATVVSPNLAKTWYVFANWCFQWGKKCTNKMHINSTSNLEENDQENMFHLLPAHTSNDEKLYILSLLSKVENITISDSTCSQKAPTVALSSNDNQQININDTFISETKHLIFAFCKSLSVEIIDNLLNEWKIIVSHVYYFHKLACKSYFAFLKLNDKVIYLKYFNFFKFFTSLLN